MPKPSYFGYLSVSKGNKKAAVNIGKNKVQGRFKYILDFGYAIQNYILTEQDIKEIKTEIGVQIFTRGTRLIDSKKLEIVLVYPYDWESVLISGEKIQDEIKKIIDNQIAGSTTAQSTSQPTSKPIENGDIIIWGGIVAKAYSVETPKDTYIRYKQANVYQKDYEDIRLEVRFDQLKKFDLQDGQEFEVKTPTKKVLILKLEAPSSKNNNAWTITDKTQNIPEFSAADEEDIKMFLFMRGASVITTAQQYNTLTRSWKSYYVMPKTGIQIYQDQNAVNKNYFDFFIPVKPKGRWEIDAEELKDFIRSCSILNNFQGGEYRLINKSGFLKEDSYEIEFFIGKTPQSIIEPLPPLTDQEKLFKEIDDKLINRLFLPDNSGITPPTQAGTGDIGQKGDEKTKTNDEATLDKYKTELAQLVFLKSIVSPIDFEQKITISQAINEKQKQINELNFHILEKKIKGKDIFEDMFEQSFLPIQNSYENVFAESEGVVDFFTPNGKKSKLSDSLNELIRTPQFKEWFGDWQLAYLYRDTDAVEIGCSTVLSENFEPLVVWHGTGQEFSYFRFDNFPAAYFAVKRAYSEWFANLQGGEDGYTIPFFLNVRNPLDLTHFSTKKISVKDFFDYMYLKTGMDMQQLEVNPIFMDDKFPEQETWVFIRNNPKMLQNIAASGVYDGIHFYETNPNVPQNEEAHETEAYITFKPEQCKIADSDRGLMVLASLKSFLLKEGGKI